MVRTIALATLNAIALGAFAACSPSSSYAPRVATGGAGVLGLDAVALRSAKAAASPGWLSDEAKTSHHLLYVSDQPAQTVYIFPQTGNNPKPIGAITQGIGAPEGLFVDRHRNLYVCNFGLATVTVYPPGQLKPSKTLTQAGESAFDVVVGLDGTVYVSNFGSGQNGQILEYAHGSTTPTTTINFAGYPEGVALDAHNNLYVAYQKSANVGTVLKFAPGSTKGKDLELPITLVGGETIDKQGNLLVADQSNPQPHVDVFPPGSKVPSKTYNFPLNFDISLNDADTHLYVTQPDNPAAVWEIAYPSGAFIQKITNTISSAFGVAASPQSSD